MALAAMGATLAAIAAGAAASAAAEVISDVIDDTPLDDAIDAISDAGDAVGDVASDAAAEASKGYDVVNQGVTTGRKDGDALAQKGLDTAHNKLEDEVNKPANALKGKPGE